MIAARKTKTSATFPRAKIGRIVRDILPKGKEFSVKVATSSIGNKKIVRVVTPAWQRLRAWERTLKLLDGLQSQLSEDEQDQILRFSVLTPKEYREVVLNDPLRRIKLPAKKKAAAKRKAFKA